MKARRQRRIAQLLRYRAVTSQMQLVKLLRDSGFPATQATVSRDLDELGAVKVRRNGRAVYILPSDVATAPMGDALKRLMAESVMSLESSGPLVVVRTPPGHAGAVASAIDRSDIEGVAGTIAGDDTILVVSKQGVLGRRVERRLRALAEVLPEMPA